MSMIGKLDATMYAINHAEETGRNVHRAAGWLSKHSGSIKHGLDTAHEAVKSHTPTATPTTAPSAVATHDAVRSQVESTTMTNTAATQASPVHAAAAHAVADHPGVINWFAAAPVGVKAIVVIAAVIVIATVVSLVRRLVRSRRAR